MRYIVDVLFSLLERLAIFIIIIVLSLLVIWRLDNLLDVGIVKMVDEEVSASGSDDLIVENEGDAPIVLKGQNSENKDSVKDVESIDGTNKDQTSVVSFEIYQGESPLQVGEKFQQLGLIESANWFVLMLEDLNLSESLRPGSYDVPSDITNVELIETITVSTALQELEAENPGLQEQVPEDGQVVEEIPEGHQIQNPENPGESY